jgi:glutamine amidotransferase
MITILDYGLGNLAAIANVYKPHNIPVSFAKRPQDVESAERVIIPGVGSFDTAMSLLNESGMRGVLEQKVLSEKVPVLGICVGMQILANSSQEGVLPGLGWIPGTVKKLFPRDGQAKIILPHMGWNDVRPTRSHPMFDKLESEAKFYFLHSFFFECDSSNDILATTDYCGEFSCGVNRGNIFGMQFHPEKSHHFGTQLLLNFAVANLC